MQLTAIDKTEGCFDPTIPVLDMQDCFDPQRHAEFIQKLRTALQEVGFFAVINTQVDQNVLDTAYQTSKAYFNLAHEAKMLSFNPHFNCQRGYVPGESAKGVSFGDFKEFYHVGRETGAAKNNYYPNVWPAEIALKDPMCALFDALEAYKIPLEQAMAEAIGQPLDFFTEMTQEGDCLLRALHYPENPPEDRLWAAAHTDIDLFTILPRATAEGLQLLNKQGEWIDVRVPENAFIVNGGDMLENITNGEFRSGPHRVVATQGNASRYSIVLFIHPRAEDRLDPLPQCIERTGGIRRFANATRWELLTERLADLGLASDEMLSYLSRCGLIERLLEVGRASPKALKRIRDRGFATPAILEALEKIPDPN
ncbi:MAG: isopenicillin N synthase family oxygenase [Burkholderiales bacterium]|nr:isopenicillin N synthase family oxygenase [Burkholderiales bacterium]